MAKFTQYCNNKLTEIFGNDYHKVLSKRSPINPVLKEAIYRAFNESENKRSFSKMTTKYTGLTKSGKDSEPLYLHLLAQFK